MSKQRVTKRDTVLAVHVEQVNGSAAFASQPEDLRLYQLEMLALYMSAWVVQGRDKTGVRIDRGDVRPLLQVAPDATKAKILDLVRAVVLAPDDVIDLVRQN